MDDRRRDYNVCDKRSTNDPRNGVTVTARGRSLDRSVVAIPVYSFLAENDFSQSHFSLIQFSVDFFPSFDNRIYFFRF